MLLWLIACGASASAPLSAATVGGVGTRAWIMLLLGRDEQDPLFLQFKEAQPSVLEEFTAKSEYANHGQRVVAGQHLMHAASDIYLGWLHVDKGIDDQPRDFYGRQLKDWKGSFEIKGAPDPALLGAAGSGVSIPDRERRHGVLPRLRRPDVGPDGRRDTPAGTRRLRRHVVGMDRRRRIVGLRELVSFDPRKVRLDPLKSLDHFANLLRRRCLVVDCRCLRLGSCHEGARDRRSGHRQESDP